MREGRQVISVTVDEPLMDSLRGPGPDGRCRNITIYFHDGCEVPLYFRRKDPREDGQVYVLVLRDNALYMESVGLEYVTTRDGMDKLLTMSLLTIAALINQPYGRVVLSPESIRMDVGLDPGGGPEMQMLADIPDDASDVTHW